MMLRGHREVGVNMRRTCCMVLLSLIAGAPLLFGQQTADVGMCAGLTNYRMPGYSIRIAKAEQVPAAAPGTVRLSPVSPATLAVALPQFCRVEGTIDPHTGADGKNYAIGFALALPANWNGRFLFQGGGGLNGNVAAPLGAGAAGDDPALARGF